MDFSSSAIEIARERAGDLPCRFEVSRIPPIPPGPFDVVLLLETMLAFPDKETLLQEISRALTTGGRFAFTMEEGLPLTEAERERMPDADTVWLTPLQEMLACLERAGLVVRWQEDCSRSHRAVADSLINAFAADATDIAAQIGRQALEELLAAHRLWSDWLRDGRVRKIAFSSRRSAREWLPGVGRSELPSAPRARQQERSVAQTREVESNTERSRCCKTSTPERLPKQEVLPTRCGVGCCLRCVRKPVMGPRSAEVQTFRHRSPNGPLTRLRRASAVTLAALMSFEQAVETAAVFLIAFGAALVVLWALLRKSPLAAGRAAPRRGDSGAGGRRWAHSVRGRGTKRAPTMCAAHRRSSSRQNCAPRIAAAMQRCDPAKGSTGLRASPPAAAPAWSL